MSASALNRRSRLEFRSWRFVVAGFVLALLVCGIEGSPVFAHENPPVDHSVDDHVHWDGTVEVRPASLTLTKGKSVTYELRLTEPPENHGVLEDGWWVMIRVDVEYEGISWVPSVGWEFTKDNWNEWRSVTIYYEDSETNPRDTNVKDIVISHEVWANNTYCPVHDVGKVKVTIADNGDGNGDGNDDGNGDGNGNGDGDGNGNGDVDGDDDGDGMGDSDDGLPTLRINDVAVSEVNEHAVFTVKLSRPSKMDVKVGYATSNETARAGQDYTGTRGTLTIASGDTVGTIPVRVLDDDLGEGDETFIMTLSAAANATISDARGIGTIKDDEFLQVRVSYGSASYTVREAEFVEVSVVLNRLPGRPITIPLTHTGSGGAVETDYSGIPDSVHFDATEMRETFRVLARRDSEQDDGERVILGFGTLPTGVTTASPDSSTVTIQDVRISRRQAPKRWLRRFAETAMVHLLEAIDERIRCAPVHRLVPGRLESQPTRRGCDPRLEEHLSYLVSVRRFPAMQATFDEPALSLPVDGSASARPIDQTFSSLEALEPRSFSAREALARSAFQVSSQVREYGQRISFWGRGALSLFNEDDNGYDLDGDVASAIFGMDYADHRVLAGIALSQSRGDGSYFDQGHDGEAEAILTGLYPYLYLGVNERISVWGAAGLGTGTLNLRFSDLEPGTNIATRMGVIGTRIEILHPEETWGVSLALKADAMLMRITSNETLDLFAARATTSRQRLALELSQEFTFMPGEWVTPFVAIGARRDGGDGETTFATEVGGGFRFESSALGLTTELNARGIIPRAAGDFEEYGVSGSLRYDSITNSTLGPYATLSIVDGFARWAESDSLWGYDVLSNRESNDGEPFGTRINTEFGYGFPVSHGTGVGTPWVGASLSERWRDWRLGYRLRFGPALSLGIDGSLRERFDVDPTPDHSIMLRLSLR